MPKIPYCDRLSLHARTIPPLEMKFQITLWGKLRLGRVTNARKAMVQRQPSADRNNLI